LKHGQAISIGMALEASLSERIGLADRGLADQIKSVLSNLGLPLEIPGDLSKPEILEVIKVDKKRSKGQVRFALPVRLGEVRPEVVVEDLSGLEF
jgi:3-dehydroquinate synthetase